MKDIIISIHLPKTGGTSFKNILTNNFQEKVFLDYADKPINCKKTIRRNNAISFNENRIISPYKFNCAHGHFLPAKYAYLHGYSDLRIKYVTWIRDPLNRMISHFFFWKNNFNEHSANLHRRMVDEDWSLEKFCFDKQLQNIYSEFFWNFDLDKLNYVGEVEKYEYSLNKITQGLGLNTKAINKDSKFNKGNYDKHRARASINKSQFKIFHKKDYELYDYLISKNKLY